MSSTANPFVNLDLRIPESEWENFRRYTATFRSESGEKADVDEAPFDRYVDLWWAGFLVGVANRSSVNAKKWHAFVTGAVLNGDPWRIRQLQLIAIADSGDVDIIDRPGDIIAIANQFAAGGIPLILDEMAGQTQPIWALSKLLRTELENEMPKAGDVDVAG